MSLSISSIARQAGVPASTLRYYDRLGLLPSESRTDNGYRRYDDRALDRLRFISRAKELGCSLDEIATLLTAFDTDCANVQGSLRDLVDGKIATAQQRVAELIALTAELQQARHGLDANAVTGPCGPGCACLSEAHGGGRPATAVVLVPSDATIACTLPHDQARDRVDEWRAALAGVDERMPIDGGIRLRLGPRADLAEIARLARAEWSCCSFFSFAVTVDGRGTALEVRAPEAAQALVSSIFGVAP